MGRSRLPHLADFAALLILHLEMTLRFLKIETCCFYFSLRSGAKLFGFISLTGCLLLMLFGCINLLIGLYFHRLSTEEEILIGVNLIVQLLQAGTSLLMLLGVYQGKATLLPWWLTSTPLVAVLESTVLRNATLHFIYAHPFQWDWILITAFSLVDDIYGWLVVFSYYHSIRGQIPDNGGAGVSPI